MVVLTLEREREREGEGFVIVRVGNEESQERERERELGLCLSAPARDDRDRDLQVGETAAPHVVMVVMELKPILPSPLSLSLPNSIYPIKLLKTSFYILIKQKLSCRFHYYNIFLTSLLLDRFLY